MTAKNTRKRPRGVIWDHGDVNADTRGDRVLVGLTDPQEPDRTITLTLSASEAQYLGHRLLNRSDIVHASQERKTR
jgi:hypothetical protein